MKYTIGVDFGTLSCRAIVVNAENGAALGMGECGYHVYDDMLPCGKKLPPRAALADPLEYMDALATAIKAAVKNADIDAQNVIGMAIDATSMSVVPCDVNGMPMRAQEKWRDEPQAYIRLWKSYTATEEAARIETEMAEKQPAFMAACGGHPSSEGMFPKLLETLRECPELYEETSAFTDLDEWLTWLLTGELTRSAGSMGLKNYCPDGKTLPDADFFAQLDARFANVHEKLRGEMLPWGAHAGNLTKEMAKKLGLPAGIPVGASGLDGHTSMMALGLHESGDAMMTIGTSGVLAVISDEWHVVSGVCGQAYNGLMPGFYGYDFCQSGVGDMFGWFVDNCVPGRIEREAKEQGKSVHQMLSERGFALPVRADAPVAVDWWNGSRSIVVDQTLAGAISGLKLSTKPEEIYRALVEAAAFGMRLLIEHAGKHGVQVKRICVCGGIASKNPLLVQCYANILGRELHVSSLPNSAAAGAAIGAAAATDLYATLDDAMESMSCRTFTSYKPDMEAHAAYEPLYARYLEMRDFYAEK